LRSIAHNGDYSLIPADAKNITVSNVKNLSGGMTNNLYSFSLKFSEKEQEQRLDLILKAYTEFIGLWFRASYPDEDQRRYIREFQTLKSLDFVGFPVPPVYLCENNLSFLGYPFLIMHKEKISLKSVVELDRFAETLANLHNLNVKDLNIQSLRFPKDGFEFARNRLICLKHYLNETRHYRDLKNDFNYAINWLESNVAVTNCLQYCLIHGEYHPGHTLTTSDNRLKVIDWENVQIGDPAFDVGYAYHMIKLMYGGKNSNSGEEAATRFVSKYASKFHGDFRQRLDFYKVVGVLSVAIVVSSWISSPVDAYRGFGYKSFGRALAFPFLRSQFFVKSWLNSDFLVSFLEYSQDFIKTSLRP
jgi:aminoglycoside phosphotransferase (APT) family kinase protein